MLKRRAQDCIAHGALTNSKRPESFVKGVYPTHVVKAKDCYLWDENGKRYIDYICGLGTNLLGYGNELIATALKDHLSQGYSPSLPTHHEVFTAEQIKQVVPYVDVMRFLKTGTEACLAAIRIARAHTGKRWILSEGYHGWSDEFVGIASDPVGIAIEPRMQSVAGLKEVNPAYVAGVIIEPISVDASRERIEWLKALRSWCDKHGVLLIFDEIITGARYQKFTTGYYYGILPDIICMGKAIANGMPLAVVGGKKEVMNSTNYFVSSTFAGEALSLVAARETIKLIQTRYDIAELWIRGKQFIDSFNSIAPEIQIEGYAVRGVFKGDELFKALFFQEACLAGILFGPSWFYNFHLQAEYDLVLETCTSIIRNIKLGSVALKGEMPQSPFAQKVRNA